MNFINVFQGNTLILDIALQDDETGEPIELIEGDVVIFTVKNRFRKTFIQKIMTVSNYDHQRENLVLTITPADTINMPPGEYFYDCVYITSDGRAYTFISSKFIVDEALGSYKDKE